MMVLVMAATDVLATPATTPSDISVTPAVVIEAVETWVVVMVVTIVAVVVVVASLGAGLYLFGCFIVCLSVCLSVRPPVALFARPLCAQMDAPSPLSVRLIH